MYALAAIPIWFTKMGMGLAGLAVLTSLLKSAIRFLTGKFEDLMFFDFSSLFSGNKKNAMICDLKVLHLKGRLKNNFK